ncbi:T-cell surface glycoprotein CD4-like [Halichoeres trimaculatus]|uniref:T-cell surface glycoprotein CD4-like n=1 Tax=Halichoeres trimaculatus TaxID=147232 RepID=UPI003D9E737B
MRTVMLFGFVLGALSAAGKVILSKPGQTAKFRCEVSSTYRTLVWTHGGSMVATVNGQSGMRRYGSGEIAKRSKASDRTLEVSDVKKEDGGKFICQVDGKAQEHTLLVVSVSVNPSGGLQLGSTATLQCEVAGSTTVDWKKPDGSQTGSGTVELSVVEKAHKGKWVCLFTHGSVTYNESLNIVVKEPPPKPVAKPTKKSPEVSHPACINCDTTALPSQFKLSWWIWVAIGVGSLVVFLLLVVVIVLCKRIRRKKRKHHRRQNGHQPMKPRQYCECNRPAAVAAKPQQGRRGVKPVALPRQPLLME